MILAVHPVVKDVFVNFLTTFFVSKSKITTEKSSRPTARRELRVRCTMYIFSEGWTAVRIKNTDHGLVKYLFVCSRSIEAGDGRSMV